MNGIASRREFLEGIVGVAAASRARRSAAPRPEYYNPARIARAGVSSWSFRNYFASTRQSTSTRPGALMTLLEFPRVIADRYDVHHLEFSSLHFDSVEITYLEQLRKAVRRAGARLVNVQVGSPALKTGGGLSDRDPAIRRAAISEVKRWIDAGRGAGTQAVSVDPGGVNAADLSPAIDSFRVLAAYARMRRVTLLIESLRAAPRDILQIIRSVGGNHLGALPDFAAFATSASRAAGLTLLFARAPVLCHASGVSFDRLGDEITFDFQQCVQIAREHRFRGIYSVVFSGPGDPYQGVQHVLNELIRYL